MPLNPVDTLTDHGTYKGDPAPTAFSKLNANDLFLKGLADAADVKASAAQSKADAAFPALGGKISGPVGIGGDNAGESLSGKLGIEGTFASTTTSVRAVAVRASAAVGANLAYCNYDAAGSTTGSNPVDHLIGYQSRVRHAGTGLLSRLYGFGSLNVIDGPTQYAYGLYVFNAAGAGALTRQYGIFIENLSKGTSGYGIWTDGAQPNVFGGSVWPKTNGGINLGDPTLRWDAVYAVTGTIQTSDAREKSGVRALTDNELAASRALASEIGAYRWLRSVQEKGDDAREHIGMTVQRAIEIMQAQDLDPFAYGFICHDTWVDDQTLPGVEAGDRYGFRTDQLLLFIARGFDQRLSALETAA